MYVLLALFRQIVYDLVYDARYRNLIAWMQIVISRKKPTIIIEDDFDEFFEMIYEKKAHKFYSWKFFPTKRKISNEKKEANTRIIRIYEVCVWFTVPTISRVRANNQL